MYLKVNHSQIQLLQGDITLQDVDSIVNAANSALAGGGGVDGAIHEAGGPAIMQETRQTYPDGCPTGHAVVTQAGNLPSRFVIHAVGPIWRGGTYGEEELLRSAYRTCLELAIEHECQSIAFPAISTGVYGYPLDLAAEISINELVEFLQLDNIQLSVYMILFSAGHYGAYSRVMESYQENRNA